MNKPCFNAIKHHSPNKPSLIFVSSRRQTRLTALDLIAFLTSDADQDPAQFRRFDPYSDADYLTRREAIKDKNL